MDAVTFTTPTLLEKGGHLDLYYDAKVAAEVPEGWADRWKELTFRMADVHQN